MLISTFNLALIFVALVHGESGASVASVMRNLKQNILSSLARNVLANINTP